MKPFLNFIENMIINVLVLLDVNSMRKPTYSIVALSKKVTSQALSKFLHFFYINKSLLDQTKTSWVLPFCLKLLCRGVTFPPHNHPFPGMTLVDKYILTL